MVILVEDKGENCQADAAGRRFTLPAEERQFSRYLRGFRASSSQVMVMPATQDITYRCFSTTLFLTQRAGFSKVGFVAEPPAKGY